MIQCELFVTGSKQRWLKVGPDNSLVKGGYQSRGDRMSQTTPCPTDGIIETASRWRVMLRDDSVSTAGKAAFVDWLLQSSTHMREYLWCEFVWSWLQKIDWNKIRAADERIRGAAKGESPLQSIGKPH